MYVSEALSFRLREELRLWVFENRIQRRIFGSKRHSNSEWRRLHNEELYSFYRSPNVVRWVGHVARMEEDRSAFKIVTGKPTSKRLLGRPRHRLDENIRMDPKETRISKGNWVDSAQDGD